MAQPDRETFSVSRFLGRLRYPHADGLLTNRLQQARSSDGAARMTPDEFENDTTAQIVAVDWASWPKARPSACARWAWTGGPKSRSSIAASSGRAIRWLRIGRMTIALRRVHARAIEVEPA